MRWCLCSRSRSVGLCAMHGCACSRSGRVELCAMQGVPVVGQGVWSSVTWLGIRVVEEVRCFHENILF